METVDLASPGITCAVGFGDGVGVVAGMEDGKIKTVISDESSRKQVVSEFGAGSGSGFGFSPMNANPHFGPIMSLNLHSSSKKSTAGISSNGFSRGSDGLLLSCGIDWTTKVFAPAFSETALLTIVSDR